MSSDDEDDTRAALLAMFDRAAPALGDKIAGSGAELGGIARTIIAIGTRNGALARDTLPEKILKASANAGATLEYLDKDDMQKGAVLINISPAGAEALLKLREADGVRYLSEDEAHKDAAFAGRLEGIMVLRVHKVPRGFNPLSMDHLLFYGKDLCEKIKMGSSVMAAKMVRDLKLTQKDADRFEAAKLEFDIENCEATMTAGKQWAAKSIKNCFFFVVRWTSDGVPVDFKFLPSVLKVVGRMGIQVREVATERHAEPTAGSEGAAAMEEETVQQHQLVAAEQRVLSSKGEDYQLAYISFCPAHSHSFCTGDCNKWQKLIKARQLKTMKMRAEGAAKTEKRASEYAQSSAGSSSKDRFCESRVSATAPNASDAPESSPPGAQQDWLPSVRPLVHSFAQSPKYGPGTPSHFPHTVGASVPKPDARSTSARFRSPCLPTALPANFVTDIPYHLCSRQEMWICRDGGGTMLVARGGTRWHEMTRRRSRFEAHGWAQLGRGGGVACEV